MMKEEGTALTSSIWSVIERRDFGLMRRIHRWTPPRWFRLWMVWASRGGDGWVWVLLGLGVLLFGGPERFRALAAEGSGAAAATGSFLIAKRWARRSRPCHLEPHCWAHLLPPDRFSFPSGHTLAAFAAAVPLGLFYPPLMAPLMFLAASIAVSRIMLGMHFLSDVVVSIPAGVAIGYLAHGLWT